MGVYSMHASALMFLVILSSLLWASASASARGVDRAALQRADEAIDSAIQRGDVPGAVLVAGTDREIVHTKEFGNRALEPEKLPVKLDTVYDLASLSKSIGCATSMM